MPKPPDYPPPIFITGCPRSGTTWTLQTVATHPDVVPIRFETRLIEVLAQRWYLHPQCGAPTDFGIRRALGPQEINDCFRAFVLEMYRRIARRKGRFVEKSPHGGPYLHVIHEIMPDATILYLIRHPIAVIESLISKDINEWHFGHTVGRALNMWLSELGAYLSSPAYDQPYVVPIYYERLAKDAAGTFASVFERLGMDPQNVPPPRFAPVPSPERFVLSEEERAYVMVRARRELNDLGYGLDVHAGPVPDKQVTLTSQHPERRLTDKELRSPEFLVQQAVERASRVGHGRTLIYGAGQHTHRHLNIFRQGPARIVGVVDDNAELAGQRVGDWTVKPADESAMHLHDVDAIIPSSDYHEDALIRRCERFQCKGVAVIPIYTQTDSAPPPTPVPAGACA
jgi:hypothetical protein